MEKDGITRCWGLLGCAGLFLVGTSSLHAEMVRDPGSLKVVGITHSTLARGVNDVGESKLRGGIVSQRAVSSTEAKMERALAKLRTDWEELRELLLRSLLETSLTAFWIKVPTAPKNGPSDPGGSGGSPGTQTGGGPPGDPTGQGDPGGNPTTIPDPNTAPEPSSIVAALLGAGLVGASVWRKRGKQQN